MTKTATKIARDAIAPDQLDSFARALVTYRAALAQHELASQTFAKAESAAARVGLKDPCLDDLEAAMTAASADLEAADAKLIGTPARSRPDVLIKLEIMAEAHGEGSPWGSIAADARRLIAAL